MGDLSQLGREARPVVAVVGGAVSGAEAAGTLAAQGAVAVVFEQNRRPYGKIEDGLPRWHDKLRQREYDRIDAQLDQAGVLFVPQTPLGEGQGAVSLQELRAAGFSAVLLANGAWRDRPLGVEGADDYVDRGLLYQNPLVHWFNHHHEADYDGPAYTLPDEVIVVGGGLASVDVAKLVHIERYRAVLAARGIELSVPALEHGGIEAALSDNGLSAAELGIPGATIYYRRRVIDMPVAFPSGDDEAALRKTQKVRQKLIDVLERKFLIRVAECHRAVAPLVEDGHMVGLRFVRTEIRDGRVHDLPGSELSVRAPLVVSSIGSVPAPLPGVPMRGELYDFLDWDTGALRGLPGVYGLGNVLTGKGNIKDSRVSAADVVGRILEGGLATVEVARQRAIAGLVETCWARSGYGGDYGGWVRA